MKKCLSLEEMEDISEKISSRTGLYVFLEEVEDYYLGVCLDINADADIYIDKNRNIHAGKNPKNMNGFTSFEIIEFIKDTVWGYGK